MYYFRVSLALAKVLFGLGNLTREDVDKDEDYSQQYFNKTWWKLLDFMSNIDNNTRGVIVGFVKD